MITNPFLNNNSIREEVSLIKDPFIIDILEEKGERLLITFWGYFASKRNFTPMI